MKDEGITLSEKHGLNPSLEVCLACGKDMGIVMFGKLKDDVEAPKQVCLGHLCDECTAKFKSEHKKVLLETTEYGSTGRYYVFPEEGILPEILEEIGDHVVVLIGEEAFRGIENTVKEAEEHDKNKGNQ